MNNCSTLTLLLKNIETEEYVLTPARCRKLDCDFCSSVKEREFLNKFEQLALNYYSVFFSTLTVRSDLEFNDKWILLL